ncbi:hypothetical protein [Desulfosporosinus youngiae]|uniref:Uncharacterized protein n=1 Tax=Desulfosporosinus youngiae DSM 17734 TaxID=768710 RepID=H5Y297_9FIRM|nr:hypothetical protein [Desulfosporosinus youngiae]EHQ88445.1 hypothetical protein DesyoDRAFT_1279 [Desulfosporosinus youngiae DSM 17734]
MEPTTLTLPAINIVPYLNMFTSWLTENLPTLLSAAGGIALVGFAFRKAKSFLFG